MGVTLGHSQDATDRERSIMPNKPLFQKYWYIPSALLLASLILNIAGLTWFGSTALGVAMVIFIVLNVLKQRS